MGQIQIHNKTIAIIKLFNETNKKINSDIVHITKSFLKVH